MENVLLAHRGKFMTMNFMSVEKNAYQINFTTKSPINVYAQHKNPTSTVITVSTAMEKNILTNQPKIANIAQMVNSTTIPKEAAFDL